MPYAPANFEELLREGFEYISKPIRPDLMLAKVREMLDGVK